MLASAYAGWGGSLSAEEADQRLQRALVLSDLPLDELVGVLLPTMFTEGTPSDAVEPPPGPQIPTVIKVS